MKTLFIWHYWGILLGPITFIKWIWLASPSLPASVLRLGWVGLLFMNISYGWPLLGRVVSRCISRVRPPLVVRWFSESRMALFLGTFSLVCTWVPLLLPLRVGLKVARLTLAGIAIIG